MSNNNDKLKKLGTYDISLNPSAEKIPAVIPELSANTWFYYSAFTPKYEFDDNITVTSGILSKKDTIYSGDNEIIFVYDRDETTKEISAIDAAISAYSGGIGIDVYNNNNIGEISIVQGNNIDKRDTGLSINDILSAHQQNQPTCRHKVSGDNYITYKTEFAGNSNAFLIIPDLLYKKKNIHTKRLDIIVNEDIEENIICSDQNNNQETFSCSNLKIYNQILIQQAQVENIYIDQTFFKEHLGKEVYITLANQFNGCNFFIKNSPNILNKDLTVHIYSCGMEASGTCPPNESISFLDISQNNWDTGNPYYYIARPWNGKTTWIDGNIIKLGYIGNSSLKTNRFQFNHWFITENGEEIEVNPVSDPKPIITQHGNFYTKNDERYNFWEYNALEISANYNNSGIIYGPSAIHRMLGYHPPYNSESFASFKFIVASYENNNNNIDIKLVDSRC
jgi:hypothetical protein